ncbi:MAG: peptidylprolyl isomerase [bacterium]|jgi:parvulin-like peptidyl-prolyl isomerase
MQRQRTLLIIGIISVLILSTIAHSFMNRSPGGNPIVAEINGTTVYRQDVLDIYNQEKEYYGLTDNVTAEQATFVQSLKEDIMERLIYQELLFQSTAAAGYPVDAAAIEKAETEFATILTTIAAQMKDEDVKAGNPSEGIDYTAKAKEYVAGELATMGTTEEEYVKLIAQQMQVDRFYNEISKDITVTAEEIEEYYNTQLSAQQEGGVADGNSVQLVEPAAVTVKHILIALPKEEKDEYLRLLSEADETAAESYLAEKLQVLKPEAEAVLAEANGGADFEALIAEHGEDPGMETYPDGYTVRGDGQFAEAFETASLALDVGAISDLVATYHGYHIIKAYSRTEQIVHSLESKKEEISAALLSQKKDAAWSAKVDEWFAAATINRYSERL